MIFNLASDFAAALAALPQDHPRRRLLSLLEEAVRRDVHFIDRHPTTLFQCMWNSCWWYDCPEAAAHYVEGKGPGAEAGIGLHQPPYGKQMPRRYPKATAPQPTAPLGLFV